MKKTNAQRLLESKNILYRATVYDESGKFHSAEDAAALIGAPLESVYKTLVVLQEAPRAKPLLVMVPSTREIDFKALARAIGAKRVRMATQREAEELTGLQVGGISALALYNRGFDVCIDQSALTLEDIHISGGARGMDIALRVSDLIELTRARTIQVTASAGAG
jgi:Cys-tRNA(Pro)/Cys-tRNA(Cys) deacylase